MAIYVAQARWDDDYALAAVFAPLPKSIVADIRAGHAQHAAGFSMRHDASTNRAFYIKTDAVVVQVWTLTECSENLAAELWAELDGVEPNADVPAIMRAYSRVTGSSIDYVH